MENSILYTFSTIAQALGGAFALLSAFVLFRFQSLDASILCMCSYLVVIYAALASRYGKDIIQPRIDALMKGS